MYPGRYCKQINLKYLFQQAYECSFATGPTVERHRNLSESSGSRQNKNFDSRSRRNTISASDNIRRRKGSGSKQSDFRKNNTQVKATSSEIVVSEAISDLSLSKDKVKDLVESESSGSSLLPSKSNASMAPELKVHSVSTSSPDKSKDNEEISPDLNKTPDLPPTSAVIEKDSSIENASNPIDTLDVKLKDLQAEKGPMSESADKESSELIKKPNDVIPITKNYVSSDETSKPKPENESCSEIQSTSVHNVKELECDATVKAELGNTDIIDADNSCKSTDCQKDNLVK